MASGTGYFINYFASYVAYSCNIVQFNYDYYILIPAKLLIVSCKHYVKSDKLKTFNRSFYHSAPAWWNSLPPELPRLSYHFTSERIAHNSPPYELSIFLFLKKLKTCSLISSHLISLSFRILVLHFIYFSWS